MSEKLNSEEIVTLVRKASTLYVQSNKNMNGNGKSFGKAFAVALSDNFPELWKEVENTDKDPSENDLNMPNFIIYITNKESLEAYDKFIEARVNEIEFNERYNLER